MENINVVMVGNSLSEGIEIEKKTDEKSIIITLWKDGVGIGLRFEKALESFKESQFRREQNIM